MAFDDLLAGVNSSCLAAFKTREDFTFTRVESSPSGASFAVSGILDTGVEPEDVAPGDGSTYAKFWLPSSNISPAPSKGDEIASATTIYKIVRMEEDAGGGLWMLLRKDREVV